MSNLPLPWEKSWIAWSFVRRTAPRDLLDSLWATMTFSGVFKNPVTFHSATNTPIQPISETGLVSASPHPWSCWFNRVLRRCWIFRLIDDNEPVDHCWPSLSWEKGKMTELTCDWLEGSFHCCTGMTACSTSSTSSGRGFQLWLLELPCGKARKPELYLSSSYQQADIKKICMKRRCE